VPVEGAWIVGYPKEIGHLVINVTDVDKSVEFYRDVVGFEITRYRPGIGAFMSCGVIHHNLALSKASPDAPRPQKGQVGLNHFAFKVENYETLQRAYDRFLEAGVVISNITDHGITRSLYFEDPDGLTMELFADGFADQKEGMRYIKSTQAHGDHLDLTGPEPARPEIPATQLVP
jgi:catechol 2,3-dioxygenase